ncbi:transporter substrate-binding domain-containing protein [Azospirillum sp. RWY-5-1]|uniref:Transporter substrate-binding domain-containing protein n=1 Tax=Azospirillum oleiclasticum TaxID=2735135 RepID=A0ABX2TGB8_9PROT|nr:transporter substrate-binding domain-containing protein [Azospirillum oleiclasticum]NYZ14367.1 transporter substrate-binding domain-containing protein [Azospirillum oleiclasticum]NYZ23281.1 transporter substrate-binding domain-containing protein [Azospirillum oleiclasticum]
MWGRTLIISGLLAAGLAITGTPAQAGPVFDRVKAQNNLRCGVGGSIPTFSRLDDKGEWSGLDVDYCRAVAAAVLGDPKRVSFVPLTLQQRFTALQSGEVDLLARDSVVNLTRDASLGVISVAANFHTGAGFIVRRDSKVTTIDDLKGATFCISQGNTALQNLADTMKSRGADYKVVQLERFQDTFRAFLSGRCDAAIAGAADLAGAQVTMAPNPADFVVLEQLMSNDPYSLYVARGDWEWFTVVRWVHNALVEAENRGINQANVREIAASSTDVTVRRMLGSDDNLGGLLGVQKDWVVKIVESVGNYGEIYDRHFGAKSLVKMPRGLNNVAAKGGLLYSPPFN